jgi:hypothetical protein
LGPEYIQKQSEFGATSHLWRDADGLLGSSHLDVVDEIEAIALVDRFEQRGDVTE